MTVVMTGVITALEPPHPAGKVELGYSTKNLNEVYAQRQQNGIKFLSEPKPLHGVPIASVEDSEGAECSLSEG